MLKEGKPTDKEDYTSSLLTRESKWWKKLLNVQYPYKRNMISFRSDDTHVEFMDFDKVRGIFDQLGYQTVRQYSFPFPRVMGKIFRYNEFVSIARKN